MSKPVPSLDVAAAAYPQLSGGQPQAAVNAPREVPTKFGTFMKIAMPLLQGGLASAGSAQPTRALGGADFLPSFAGGEERERQRQMQMGLMGRQFGLQEQDRALRLAQLQNIIENQRGMRDIRQGMLEARNRAIDEAADRAATAEWFFDRDANLMVNKRTGESKPPSFGTSAVAPMAAGGADGAQPAPPTFQMGGANLPLPKELLPPTSAPAAGAQPPTAVGAAPGIPGLTPGQQQFQDYTRQQLAAKKGTKPPKVDRNTGIITDSDGTEWDKNDPNLPPKLQKLATALKTERKEEFDRQVAVAKAGAAARGEALSTARAVNVLRNGQVIGIHPNDMQPGDIVAPGSAGTGAMSKQALIDDIKENINVTQRALGAMTKNKQGFSAAQRAGLAAALADPNGTPTQFMQSFAREGLPDQQQDYVVSLFQLRENAMAMRSVLGAGQGSEDLRRAILQTLPGAGTPTADYANKQLNAFRSVLQRLERGVPKVPLPAGGGVPAAGGAAAIPPNPFRKKTQPAANQ